MFDVEKLVSIVCEVLESEEAVKKNNRKIRQDRGLPVSSTIWISSLDGSTAYRLGELSGRNSQSYGTLASICDMLDIDYSSLLAAVKSMQRWERHGGRYDRKCLTCWMSNENKERLARFIQNGICTDYYQSTGRKKAWR